MSKFEEALSFRRFDMGDIQWLKDHWDGTYDLEVHSNVISDRLVFDSKENTRAFGMLKNMAEAVIVLDKTASKRTQVESLKLLFQQAIKTCKELKIADLHAFTTDERYANILISKFGFERVKGIPLILDLR